MQTIKIEQLKNESRVNCFVVRHKRFCFPPVGLPFDTPHYTSAGLYERTDREPQISRIDKLLEFPPLFLRHARRTDDSAINSLFSLAGIEDDITLRTTFTLDLFESHRGARFIKVVKEKLFLMRVDKPHLNQCTNRFPSYR